MSCKIKSGYWECNDSHVKFVLAGFSSYDYVNLLSEFVMRKNAFVMCHLINREWNKKFNE